MPVQTRCPHCDSPEIRQMPDRIHESTSIVTWYQCGDCRRMWNLPKSEQPPRGPDADVN